MMGEGTATVSQGAGAATEDLLNPSRQQLFSRDKAGIPRSEKKDLIRRL
jgi:hypothetical protein